MSTTLFNNTLKLEIIQINSVYELKMSVVNTIPPIPPIPPISGSIEIQDLNGNTVINSTSFDTSSPTNNTIPLNALNFGKYIVKVTVNGEIESALLEIYENGLLNKPSIIGPLGDIVAIIAGRSDDSTVSHITKLSRFDKDEKLKQVFVKKAKNESEEDETIKTLDYSPASLPAMIFPLKGFEKGDYEVFYYQKGKEVPVKESNNDNDVNAKTFKLPYNP